MRTQNVCFWGETGIIQYFLGDRIIVLDKALFSTKKYLLYFLFLNKNICCGYSLEAPH